MIATTHTLSLTGTDTAYPCTEDDTVLRAALRAGIGFPYECNVGSCGNCKFELIEGAVDMAWEQAPGWREKDKLNQRFLGCQSHVKGNCVIKFNPKDHYVPPHRPQRVQATLVSRRRITHDISEFSFQLATPLTFEPGQYALLYLPGITGARAYSMSNMADGSGQWQLQVRRTPAGVGTAALFDQVQVGQTLTLDGPYGMAYLRRAVPRDILCLAGGSGLAPMISIARAVMTDPNMAGVKLDFVYGGRTAQDVCGEDMLRALPGWGERLHFHPSISPAPEGGSVAPWTGAVGFVHEVAKELFAEQLPSKEIYFAGPPPMAMALQRMLLQAKVPFGQVHFDQFY